MFLFLIYMNISSTHISASLVVNVVYYPIKKLNVDSSAKQILKAPPQHPTTSKVSLVVLLPVNITVHFVSNLPVQFRITQIPQLQFSIQQKDAKLMPSIFNDPLSQISPQKAAPPRLLISLDDYISFIEAEIIIMLMDLSGSGCGNGSIIGAIIGCASVKF
ncbi:MAG: hypothetical protein EZS28_023865 [Streblomastix strix]|uniref:Uncharacterized protein n=1 Tax=Streblomastix strix TaxID=222440 RepID=A0A5J4VDP2_9EUKA|nr:MAG: hypothetical protein EZS28_023865 [Streblomastix strix]